MKEFFHKCKNIIFYGGIEREQHQMIKEDVAEKNRKSLVMYAICGILAFAGLTLATHAMEVFVANQIVYRSFLLASLLFLLLTLFLAPKADLLTELLCYLMQAGILAFGIVSTVVALEEKTTLFLIFQATIPLLFTLRPIGIIFLELASEIIYLVLLYNYERDYPVYSINVANSVCIMLFGLLIGTIVLTEKQKQVYLENRNIYLLETDVMTGLLNRRSFEEQLEKIRKGKKVLGVASFDVNGLKGANDNIGHHAGDELICGAADCILEAFGQYGKCFRTGGDEYVALLYQDFDETLLRENFQKVMAEWKGRLNPSIHISYGLVLTGDSQEMEIDAVIKQADVLMYKDKSDYYIKNHLERRRG